MILLRKWNSKKYIVVYRMEMDLGLRESTENKVLALLIGLPKIESLFHKMPQT